MGLDVPQGFRLARLLREKGFPVSDRCLLEDLAGELADLIKGGSGHAA